MNDELVEEKYYKISKIIQYWNDGEDKRLDSEILEDILKVING